MFGIDADISASAERPSAMASRLKPSSVATPSVTRPPLSVLAACTEAADLLKAIAEGDIASMYGARDTTATRCRSSILACVFEMGKDCRTRECDVFAVLEINE